MRPIALLWTNDSHVAGPRWYVAAPDGHADVVCASRAGRLSLHVVGPSEAASWKPTADLEFTVTARLRAGALATLFGCPATDFTGRAFVLEDVWPAARSLLARLEEGTSLEARAAVLADALELRARERARTDDSSADVEGAVRTIAASCTRAPGASDPSLAGLATSLGTSTRTLRRLFAEGVGVSARTYRSLIRLDGTVDRLRTSTASCAAIAATCGYADQSHMNRDVRRFMGHAPEELRRRLAVDAPLLRPSLLRPRAPSVRGVGTHVAGPVEQDTVPLRVRTALPPA